MGGSAVVATFDPHPDTVVRGTPPRPWITPPAERAELLHAMGVDRVEIVRFSREVQALSPEGFLDRALGVMAPLRALVMGPDFRMGKDRVGDRAYLERLGEERDFVVREVPFLEWAGGKLSSTLLRGEIGAGRMEAAKTILGRPYSLEGRVGSGAGRGTELGYPTANLEILPEKLLPAPGIYISKSMVGETAWPSITYVGSAATFGPGPVRVEVYLLDFADSLRGERMKTLLISQVRADQTFGSAEDLVRAMKQDVLRARAYWSGLKVAKPAGA
jgi:riboflavin kinase/FMN adenylyltransferase